MNYNFSNKYELDKFTDSFGEGIIGNQASVFFDNKNNKVIKIFSCEGSNFDGRAKEAKINELMKYKHRFPTAALPETVIRCKGKCVGYVMPKISNATSVRELQIKARKRKDDWKKNLEIACELARFINDLHNAGIVFGDLHPDQFLTKDGKIYVCDTDTWGLKCNGIFIEADKAGKPEYVDPKVSVIESNGLTIKGYTQKSDCYSLAVVVFEMLVGFNPYDGTFPLVRRYNRQLRALNHISILGNHDLKNLDDFRMEHVAWMSEGLQSDFFQIFEGNKRFNILPSLENQAKDLKKCRRHQYYNSSRYSKCPCCRAYQDSDALNEFRNYNVDNISYKRNRVFAQKQVRKVVNFSTILDYDTNAIHLKENGRLEKASVNSRTDDVCFTERGLVVKVSRISKIKQFFNTLFGKFNELYGRCSFSEKMKRCRNSKDPACELEIFNNKGKKLFSTLLLKLSSKMLVVGDHLFYLKGRKELVDVYMTENACSTKVVTTITDPFIYEINERGEYCMCSINNAGHLNIIVNGKEIRQLIKEFPKAIKYDHVSQSWCVVTLTAEKAYKVYIISKSNKATQKFQSFSFGGLNLRNCIFNNSMLVIPAEKRILFLKTGPTIEKSTVTEKHIGVVNPNSRIAIQYNSYERRTYLYVQNSDQVYKISLS